MKRALATGLILFSVSFAGAQPNKDAYELQTRCGKQAADVFRREYIPVQKTAEGQRVFGYENHFSQGLNKCFFLEIATTVENGKWSKLMRLFDLNENKEYGSYFDSDKTPGFVDCYVRDVRCSSEQEWRMLAKPYLED